MTLNPERISSVNPLKSLEWNWKWEKKHWLLVISAACLGLFCFGSSCLEASWFKKAVELLPLIGSGCFAAEAILKLSS